MALETQYSSIEELVAALPSLVPIENAPHDNSPFDIAKRLLTSGPTHKAIAQASAAYMLHENNGAYTVPESGARLMEAEYRDIEVLNTNPDMNISELDKSHRGIVHRVWGVLSQDPELLGKLQKPWIDDPNDPNNTPALIGKAVLSSYHNGANN